MTYLSNRNWVKSLSETDVQNKEFSIGYLLNTNTHIDLIKELRDKVLSKYRVVAEFSYLGYNGDSIKANGQTLVFRKNKFESLMFGTDVVYVKGNLSNSGGGSNRYPSVAFKGAKCTIEFTSYGLPYIDRVNGWDIKILKLTKV